MTQCLGWYQEKEVARMVAEKEAARVAAGKEAAAARLIPTHSGHDIAILLAPPLPPRL